MLLAPFINLDELKEEHAHLLWQGFFTLDDITEM